MIDKATSGKLPADTTTDAKHASLIQGAQLVARNNNLDPSKTSVLDRQGNVATLDSVAKSGTSQAIPRPAGATMKVPGSDGRMHWSDGKSDLGIAQ